MGKGKCILTTYVQKSLICDHIVNFSKYPSGLLNTLTKPNTFIRTQGPNQYFLKN